MHAWEISWWSTSHWLCRSCREPLSQQSNNCCSTEPWLAKAVKLISEFHCSSFHFVTAVFRGIFRRDSFWDWLVFKKIQDSLGGRVRIIITGSAPISKEVWCIACYNGVFVTWTPWGQSKCLIYQGVLIFQVGLCVCVDYTGVLVVQCAIHVSRLHCITTSICVCL